MKYLFRLLLIGFVLGAALSSCRTARPVPARIASQAIPADTAHARQPVAAPTATAARPDSVRVNPARWLIDKIRGKDRPGRTYAHPTSVTVSGKKSTVTVYEGPATITTVAKKATVAAGEGATVVRADKKAGPVVVADSGAHVQVASAKRGPAAAAGHDAVATETKPAGTTWQVWLLRAGITTAAGLALWFGWPLLAAWWARRRDNDLSA